MNLLMVPASLINYKNAWKIHRKAKYILKVAFSQVYLQSVHMHHLEG